MSAKADEQARLAMEKQIGVDEARRRLANVPKTPPPAPGFRLPVFGG